MIFRGLQIAEMDSLTVPEAASGRSRCGQGRAPPEAPGQKLSHASLLALAAAGVP